ncbi:CheA signal transduction histidine kinase [Stanieria cyanosphaera PCC 7437]|uniref:histidine kinase n=1 Tax=Stanieria cyanosphaera (strain ATCC 29371 / PCC 7437) TaxID=111780 RepID=K9XXU4_STAC7|nr:response regulator [Stanieria cyanosphaera]AFZ36926.1 CheA signal transduction histidine kinase [Stanieria cyanosphaera PCC 7437]
MSSQLDPAILAAITQEARQCFLDEDAPEYLQALTEGFDNRYGSPDFTSILRAAHSLKGGAGLAALPSLQELAHKLEDVLQGIQQNQIEEIDSAWTLVESAINEIAFVLTQARTVDDVVADGNLIAALEVLGNSVATNQITSQSQDNNNFLEKALTQDLEACFVNVEELPEDAPEILIKQCLESFIDECTFLGETLNLTWLVENVAPLSSVLAESAILESLLFTKEIISLLRNQRDSYLLEQGNRVAEKLEPEGEVAVATSVPNTLVINALTNDLESSLTTVEEIPEDAPEILIQQCLENFVEECTFLGETLNLVWLIEMVAPLTMAIVDLEAQEALSFAQEVIKQLRTKREQYLNPQAATETLTPQVEKTALAQIRIPLQNLEGVTNNVEELILIQGRLFLQQTQLKQANQRLRSLTRQFEPLREQIQNLYNQLAIESIAGGNSTFGNNNLEFDSLELDRYTELHSSLQTFQELMLQIQETRTDLDLVNQEVTEDLEQVEKNLGTLYTKVTESRLVPFRILAQRFIPQIQTLNRRYQKSVHLEIQGQDTLVDQVLLEQLQTPLTHLLNNAFDHGIESPEERQKHHKSETSAIALDAKVNNNQLVIKIQDDGRGIDLEKVYQRAKERGICPSDREFNQFSSEEIINWIFLPDFSTASQVTDLSGRGMGLDIVRTQIRKLRGNLQVQTQFGQGTTFTIKLPLNLSLMSLLLTQVQNRILAIPSNSVKETLLYSELDWTTSEKTAINWHQKTVSIVSLASLLPCPRSLLVSVQAKVAIVLETALGELAILVDSLLGEDQLIVKPFDDTIPIPAYLAGCTILGTGEVIPVILPQGLEIKSAVANIPVSIPSPTLSSQSSTILIAEDSVATRRMLEKILSAVGYQVIVCRDGQEALDVLDQHQTRIDLVLSDIEMPRVNGFELLQKIRSHPVWEEIPVVMATSRTGDRHRQQAMDLGATGYLGKPIQPQELLEKVESLLLNR